MINKTTFKGFALIEIVVVTLLLGGAFIVFIEALNQTKLMQVKSEIKTTQTVLLNSKINQLRSTPFSSIFPVNNFIEIDSNPGYYYKIDIKHTDQSFTTMIMGNHGVLVIGETVADTFNRLYYFERAAETYIRALQTGQPLRVLSDEVASKVADQLETYPEQDQRHFEELKAILDEEGSNYSQ